MNTWDLTPLYKGFDDPKLKTDLKTLEGLTDKYKVLIDQHLSDHQSPIKTLEVMIKEMSEDESKLRVLGAYGSLSYATDTRNQNAIALQDKVFVLANQMTLPLVSLKKWLAAVDNLKALAEKSELINTHLFYLESLKDQNKYSLSEEEEMLIASLKNTGSTAWEMLQSTVSSQLTGDIELEGDIKTLPIMSLRNLAYDANPLVRKKAYEAELKAYEKHAEISAAALNSIKGEVLYLSELRGFDSPLSETLYNARMSKATLDAMIESMEAYLPHFRRYIKAKAKHLGHQGPMPFYDLLAPVSKEDKDYSIEEAKTFVVNSFADFSSDLSQFAQRAFDENWVDFEPKAGKRGGAFCSNIPPIGQSRVLLNFNGKLKNVLTIAHELGHGFHGDRLKDEAPFNTHYPMPLAETASIFCETVVRNATLKTADDDLKIAVLEDRLQGATQVIVDILSRFYFESTVFEKRKDHPLSVEEFKDSMLAAQKKAYGDALDEEVLHPYMWLNKVHYYYAARNYYNFPYAFGLLFATGLYDIFKEKGPAFTSDYDKLLKATGKMSIESVCQSVGIDTTQKDFWVRSLELIKADIDLYETLV